MEQIFFRMHVRVSRTISRLAGGKTRIAIETAIFLAAVTMLSLTVLLHMNFVSPHGQDGCFAQYIPRNIPPLLRIDIDFDTTWIHTIGNLFNRVFHKPNRNTYIYTSQKGLLTLIDYPNSTGNIHLPIITISIPASSDCFGVKYIGNSPIWSLFLDKIVGFDTIFINQFIFLSDGKGFLRNELSKDTYNLNYASEFAQTTSNLYSRIAFKIGIFLTILFLFFSTTTLVSFILRETQQRMLRFTLSLQYHIRHHMSYVKLVFRHIIESLVFVPIMVGMLFFLFEFFKDRLLAFMVMSLVWLCELYSVICVRTWLSLQFFPPLFLSFFAIFHVYFFCYPFGFSYVALWTTIIFLLHQMVFFLNRFELPALRQRLISSNTPRQFILAQVGNV